MKLITKYKASFIFLALFLSLAILLSVFLQNAFYFFNFTYIGCAVSIGTALSQNKIKGSRIFIEFAIGLYMLVFLGFIEHENMQIEGFWYFLFLGMFSGATIHYAVAKIFGPFIFGRGWCGYACWTAMILDLLPYKVPRYPRKRFGWIRILVLAGSFLLVATLMALHFPELNSLMFYLFVIGNVIYYAFGIGLAFAFKDNRAFCKYLCPVAVIMKPGAYYSLIRIQCEKSKCIGCKKCLEICPMNVDMLNNNRNRYCGTECILCMQCIGVCPTGALSIKTGGQEVL